MVRHLDGAGRQMTATAAEEFAGLMQQWAVWITSVEALGYSTSTPVWRAQFGSGGEGFASAPPMRVELLEIRGKFRALVEAMEELIRDSEARDPVVCLQYLYRYGREEAAKAKGIAETALYKRVSIGEALVRREMRRVGY